ncbi:MAG: hypothetical protein H7X88_11920, partial [Gloeobacteraceae cyanobacterium ES-bin-316]|nr:hypothetical protein [Ferruginibacter sp.]
MNNKLFRSLTAVALGAVFFVSCKKNTTDLVATVPVPIPVPTPVVNTNIVKDSSLFFARDIYLWNTQLADSMNARAYADPAAIMLGIRPYSKEPGFNGPVDRWSFAMKKVDWDKQAAGMSRLADASISAGDFGLTVFFKSEGDLRVRLVEPNSPAGQAGIKRGWRITALNGNSNMITGNSDFIIDNIYKSTSTSFSFTKPDNSSARI